jgi:hypothetical protein
MDGVQARVDHPVLTVSFVMAGPAGAADRWGSQMKAVHDVHEGVGPC